MAKLNFQLTKEQQQYIILAVLTLGGGGYFYYRYFWGPVTKTIADTRKRIGEVDERIRKAQMAAARESRIRQELEVLSQQASEAEKQLPKSKDLPAVIDTVSALSVKHNVSVRNFAPGGQAPSQYFVEIPYTISMVGSYHDAARFFAAVALEERIFNVRGVTYSAPDADGKLTVSFTLVSYQYKG